MDTVHQLIVPEEVAGVRLVDFLEQTWPEVDHGALRQAIQRGLVSVNRMDAGMRTKLRTGDVVEAAFDPASMRQHESARARADLRVLVETPHFLVVDKPARLHTVPDRGRHHRGVHGLLAERWPDDDLRIVHRLDFETSGCLILARGLDAARFLDAAFQDGRIGKRYIALVEGVVRRDRFESRKSLGPDPRRPGKVRVVADGSKGARAAHTCFEVLERFRTHTLVAAEPRTGRGHQIRVHLRHSGHGIAADEAYGSPALLLSRIKRSYKLRRGVREKPLLTRMFLHAARLRVPRPDRDEPVEVEAPLPDDLQVALTKLRHFAPFAR